MATPTETGSPVAVPNDKIIVALDVDETSTAMDIVRELDGHVGGFKIGLQLFTSAGPKFVRDLADSGTKIFLDLKFHDIPNTVAKASVRAAALGVWMFNVHAAGGSEMLRRTVAEVSESCEKQMIVRPLIIGVTVLTSSNQDTLHEVGILKGVEEQVGYLARLAALSGLDGVVASPNEVGIIRREVLDPTFLTVTPGIRSESGTQDDQKRVTTLGQALANGSSYVVIGRPITQAKSRIKALDEMLFTVSDRSNV